jgi:hypothetical protein
MSSQTATPGANWTTFQTPALIQDFSADASLQAALNAQWNTNLQGFTAQGITGNPWSATHASDQTWYFNPTTPADGGAPQYGGYAQIFWSPVPGRISFYFPTIAKPDLWSLADTGYNTQGQTFGQITTNPCNYPPPTTDTEAYGPYGPRGWQDEYCEWSVTRNSSNQITRIDFTCENPEYWNTLWMISPDQVLALYRSTLDKPQIQMSDLELKDARGNVVIDPSTGRAAYNPLNIWNSGTVSTASAGGAMHLTATPNTIQTEIGLAAGATIPRTGGNANAGTLICCAQYGQLGRNSDPHIGQSVNQVVYPPNPSTPSALATLANPPGLYIQMPDFSRITDPSGKPIPASFWTIKRGNSSIQDGTGAQMPGNFILHAVLEVPASYGYTISDLSVDGIGVQWAAQIAQTFNMQIVAMAVAQTDVPAPQSCVGSPAQPLPQPLQLFHADVFTAMLATPIANPVGEPMNLASNSTIIAPLLAQGTSQASMILVVGGIDTSTALTLDFGAGVTATISGPLAEVTYAIPGNTYPSTNVAVPISLSVAQDAATGLRGCTASTAGQTTLVAFPAAINIVAG